MGRSQETRNKKEVRTKKEKKRKDKEIKKQERKESGKSSSFEEMIAYVDENGMISTTPPDPMKKKKINIEDIEVGVPKRVDMEPENPIRKGIVTYFSESKAYGFIRDLESQDSIFVHKNGLIDSITDDDKVTFEIQISHKGPNAVNVKIDK